MKWQHMVLESFLCHYLRKNAMDTYFCLSVYDTLLIRVGIHNIFFYSLQLRFEYITFQQSHKINFEVITF